MEYGTHKRNALSIYSFDYISIGQLTSSLLDWIYGIQLMCFIDSSTNSELIDWLIGWLVYHQRMRPGDFRGDQSTANTFSVLIP